MILRLIREPSSADNTFGVLFIDGFFECFTLENSHKIIPSGTYSVTLYESPRFKKIVPLLMGVKDRSMIEIHPGNYYHELEGCIGVGEYFDTMLHNSQLAFEKIMALISKSSIINIRIENWNDYTTTNTR